jgi:hemerythrin-like metal-binding protein
MVRQLGDARMDSDHDTLLRLAGQIEVLLAGRGNTTRISGKLVSLYRLAEEHFSYEDTLMAEIPDGRHQDHVTLHKARHAEFIKVVMAISARAKGYESVEVLRRMYGGVLPSLLAEMLELDAELIGIVTGRRPAGDPPAHAEDGAAVPAA